MGPAFVRALRNSLRFLNIIVRFVFGQDAVDLRNRFHARFRDSWQAIVTCFIVYILLSFSIPAIGVVVGYLVGLSGHNGAAHAIMAGGFLVSALAWVILVLASSGFLKLVSIISTPMKGLEETVDFYYNPENVKSFFSGGFTAITWVVVASLYCSIIPIWNSLTGLITLIPIVIFLIVSSVAGWVKPSVKTYKRVWVIVFGLFLITTFRFLPDAFWIKTTGKNPPRWFNFHYSQTQQAIARGEKAVDKAKDLIASNKLQPAIIILEKAMQRGAPLDSLVIYTNQAQVAIDSAKIARDQDALPNMAVKTSGVVAQRVKEALPPGKGDKDEPRGAQNSEQSDYSAATVIYHDTLTIDGGWQLLDTPPQLGYRYQFDLPDDKAPIKWRHENNPKTEKTLTILKGYYSAVNIKSTNPSNVLVEVRTLSGRIVKVPLTVTKEG